MLEHLKNIHNLGTTSWSGWRQISLSSAFHNFWSWTFQKLSHPPVQSRERLLLSRVPHWHMYLDVTSRTKWVGEADYFCLAIFQDKKTVCDQWGDLSKWKLIRTWLTNSTYSKSIQGQDKASCSKLWASSSGNRRMLGMVILLLKLECVLPVFQPKTWKWNRRCCI